MKNFYDAQLEAMREILLAAGFIQINDHEFRVPEFWHKLFAGDEHAVKYILSQTWKLKDAVGIYIEYLLKMSATIKTETTEPIKTTEP